MIQPSAPLMKRYNGTTMRDGVYEQMTMDRNSGVAGMRNPSQSTGVFATDQPIGTSNCSPGTPPPRP